MSDKIDKLLMQLIKNAKNWGGLMSKYQESLNNLESIPFDEDDNLLGDYETTIAYGEDGEEYQFNVRETFSNLQELVDKETPIKPNLEGDGYWNGELVMDTWICPNCDKHYEVDYDKYDYCPNCGQHIDWSDYE